MWPLITVLSDQTYPFTIHSLCIFFYCCLFDFCPMDDVVRHFQYQTPITIQYILYIYIYIYVHTADGIFTKKLNETFSPAAPIELFSDLRERTKGLGKNWFSVRG